VSNIGIALTSSGRSSCLRATDRRALDLRPSGRAELDRSHESPDQQLLDEIVNLLPVCDAGERRVLSADEHAEVQHDGRQEASLTLCETERHEDLSRFGCRLFRPKCICG
jgi:hypothetical protein